MRTVKIIFDVLTIVADLVLIIMIIRWVVRDLVGKQIKELGGEEIAYKVK